jgi:dimethylargininase
MSETFTRAIVRPPAANFADGLTRVDLGKPSVALALEQHRKYCAALRECGLALIELPADDAYPDSTFVEDTAILTARWAIRCRPGADSRAGEAESIARELGKHFPRIDAIEAPGSVDGGDICEVGEHFFIGISDRTNAEGAAQLAALLANRGCTSSTVDIRGIDSILHLKSGIAYVGDGRIVLIDALREHPAFAGYEKIRVEPGEEYAANCIRVNDRVLVASGYPRLSDALARLGYSPLPLDMTEYHKMDGGLSCLSLRF